MAVQGKRVQLTAECDFSGRSAQTAFITAPSITTPLLTNFHSATSSLRARATIVTFLPRPLFCFMRSLNQRLSAEVGWCYSHNHASWTMVLRSVGFPDWATPCSCRTDPLCQGVGANPA